MKSKKEGWMVSFNTEAQCYEIQKDDEAGIFKTDRQAKLFVEKGARYGNDRHIQALNFVQSQNERMIKTVSIAMTHSYSMRIMIMTLESGSEAGKKIAREELMKIAEFLDQEHAKKKQDTYKVKLLKGHRAKPKDKVGGYLGNVFNDGKVATYTRGEAIKKARSFGGKIEKIK